MLPDAQWFTALPWMLALALVGWVVATVRHNVGLVDIVWPLWLLLAAAWFHIMRPDTSTLAVLVLALTAIWALRLAIHLAVRNWNAPEDKRYQEIRRRNEPGFWWKSAYLVFALQTVLAFVVSAPLYAAITAPAQPPRVLAWLGAVIMLAGLMFEAVADWQLTRHLAQRRSRRNEVMDRGLWRYSRHPNYFGEFCVWWGFYLIAAAHGGWWSIVSPLLMSVLLLRISGVTLLEKDLRRRPAYADYMARTNAFFPGPRRRA